MTPSKILIVEDERISAEAIKKMLQKLGYVVSAIVATGPDAIKAVETDEPDLILMDIKLRGEMDGIEAASQIRKRFDMPLIYLTAYADGQVLERAKITGPYGYIVKPVFERELHSNIEMALYKSRTDHRIKRLSEELKEVNDRLAMLLASLPIVPFTCKADGEFELTYINASIEEMTGYKSKDFTEDPSFWTERIAPEDRKRVFGDLSALLAHGIYSCEYRFKIADGSYRWFRDMRRIVRNSDGIISHIAGIWYDITEERSIRQESEYRLKQVIHSDKLASLGRVVAGVAHEINNPNSFITYNIPLLEDTWQIFEPILVEYAEKQPQRRVYNMTMDELFQNMREIIQAIKTGSERINRVVLDLKDFIRPDNSYNLKPIKINEVIDKALTIVGAQIRKSVSGLEINLSEHLPAIQGWLQKLEQVVINLVVNATQAISSKQKGRLSITTRYLERIKSVLIQIEDNGIGMAPEVLECIFEPFFTTRRDAGGTGLGISISYDLIKEHHGTIGVLSRPGLGTRLTVFLPVDADTMLNLRPLVLHVEDDKQFRKLLRSYFIDTENMSIKACTSPGNVLKHLELYPEVDIVLSNIKMLKMNRWELLRQIKEQFPLIHVILYSDAPGHPEKQNVNLSAFDHQLQILQKPFEVEQLTKIIDTIGRQRL